MLRVEGREGLEPRGAGAVTATRLGLHAVRRVERPARSAKRFGVSDLGGSKVQGVGLRVEGLGFRVYGLGFRVQGSGSRV